MMTFEETANRIKSRMSSTRYIKFIRPNQKPDGSYFTIYTYDTKTDTFTNSDGDIVNQKTGNKI